MMTINNRFGVLLAEKCVTERRNISLSEISKDTNIPRQTLYGWQNNTVTRYDAHIMDALCEYFHCEPGNLFHYVSMKDEDIHGKAMDDLRNDLRPDNEPD